MRSCRAFRQTRRVPRCAYWLNSIGSRARFATESRDEQAIVRQRNVAVVLFTELDDIDAAPALRTFLATSDIDLDAMLGWLQPGTRAITSSERLALVERAHERLRPVVEAAADKLSLAEPHEIATVGDRLQAALTAQATHPQR